MSTVLLADDWVTARKRHGCNACLGTIAAGDRYRRQRLIDDVPYTYKAHALCDAAYWHVYHDNRLWDDDQVPPEEIHDALAAVWSLISLVPPSGETAE